MSLWMLIALMIFFVSFGAMAIAVVALIEIRGLKGSTHKVQYMPVDNPTTGKDLLKQLHPELADGEDYA